MPILNAALRTALMPAWLRHYPRQHLGDDVLAGVMVAVLVLPQSLAYAMLAGLPPQAGLYASILPVLVYAWVGSSNTQSVGPVAITAIMTAAVLTPLAEPGSARYLALAAGLALLSGALILAFGLLRLGFLAQLLSRPVVSGFISGSAVLIVISQLKLLLGLPQVSGNGLVALAQLLRELPQAHGPTLLLSALAIAALLAGRRWLKPALQRVGAAPKAADLTARTVPLMVVGLATLAVVVLQAEARWGLAVVGPVAVGGAGGGWLGGWGSGPWDAQRAAALASTLWADVQLLAGPAVVLAFIGMVQNITMAQALAVQRRETVDANRELVGLGAANVVATFQGGMPVGGGMSRTAINVAVGARSPLASVVTALTMGLIVLAGTGWVAHMPQAALAATIAVAAGSMIDTDTLRQAWRYDRADALAWLGTALGVLVLGLQWGIELGIGLSLATLLVRASAPHMAVIGRIPGTEHFRNVQRHGVQTLPGVLMLRIDESLFFGNLAAVQERLSAELAAAPDTRAVVLILSAVNRIDTTALAVLSEWQRDWAERGIALHLAEVKGPVQDRLAHTPLWHKLQAAGCIHLSANQAFEHLKKSGPSA